MNNHEALHRIDHTHTPEQTYVFKGVICIYREQGSRPSYAFQDERFIEKSGNWTHYSLDGLHHLANGDELTIYSPDDNSIVWSGSINLTDDIQTSVDMPAWTKYFTKEYPAQLQTKKSRLA